MAWISVAANRWASQQWVELARNRTGHKWVAGEALRVALAALELGSKADIDWALDLIDVLSESYLKRFPAKKLRAEDSMGVGIPLSIALLASLRDPDKRDTLEEFAELHTKGSNAESKLLGQLASEVLQPATSRKRSREVAYPRSSADFFKVAKTLPLAEALNIAHTPDHPLYGVMQHYVLPLSFALAATSTQSDQSDPAALLARGPFPERRGDLLFSRPSRRPDHNTTPAPDDPLSWGGIDVLEQKNDELLAYNYLGFTWKAPIVFEQGVDGFRFLKTIDLGWRLVEKSVAAKVWSLVANLRGNDRVRHVVVFSGHEAMVSRGDLERASAHYGVKIDAMEILEA